MVEIIASAIDARLPNAVGRSQKHIRGTPSSDRTPNVLVGPISTAHADASRPTPAFDAHLWQL